MGQPSLRGWILFSTAEAHLAGTKGVSRSPELNCSLFWSYILIRPCFPIYVVMLMKKELGVRMPLCFPCFYMPWFPWKAISLYLRDCCTNQVHSVQALWLQVTIGDSSQQAGCSAFAQPPLEMLEGIASFQELCFWESILMKPLERQAELPVKASSSRHHGNSKHSRKTSQILLLVSCCRCHTLLQI